MDLFIYFFVILHSCSYLFQVLLLFSTDLIDLMVQFRSLKALPRPFAKSLEITIRYGHLSPLNAQHQSPATDYRSFAITSIISTTNGQ